MTPARTHQRCFVTLLAAGLLTLLCAQLQAAQSPAVPKTARLLECVGAEGGPALTAVTPSQDDPADLDDDGDGDMTPDLVAVVAGPQDGFESRRLNSWPGSDEALAGVQTWIPERTRRMRRTIFKKSW